MLKRKLWRVLVRKKVRIFLRRRLGMMIWRRFRSIWFCMCEELVFMVIFILNF